MSDYWFTIEPYVFVDIKINMFYYIIHLMELQSSQRMRKL